MASPSHENAWIRRTRWLTQALIISGTLNIGFVATFAYSVLKQKQNSFTLTSRPLVIDAQTALPTNISLLRSYALLPYQELILRLENKELVEEGLSKRDLALACLVSFHHFNLEKALGGLNLQKRQVVFSNSQGQETVQIAIFPGLADYQFNAIVHYAKTETWPLTDEGLFYEVKRSTDPKEPSLLAAFYLSGEYHTAYTLLTKSGLNLSREEVIDLLAQGDWELLHSLYQEQRITLDLSIDKRRQFLLGFLKTRSKKAAELLITHDLDFVAKRCSDEQLLTLLDLYAKPSPALEQWAREWLLAPRTEAVSRKAASLLYSWAQEEWKEPYDLAVALQRFCPTPTPTPLAPPAPVAIQAKAHTPQPPAKKKTHTVETGDNLWKIARKYQVSIDELMRVNHLESERLRPGKQLEIPEKTLAR